MFQMIQKIYIWFYALKIWKAITIALAAVAVWALLGAMLIQRNRRLWRFLNCVLFAAAFAVISYVTLFRAGSSRNLILQPFYTFIMARENREFYREMLMNAILFIPIGLTIPYILPSRWKPARRVLFAVGLALIISTALETLQYCFCVGMTETDDVITNTFGAFVGALQFPIATLFQRCFFKKKE